MRCVMYNAVISLIQGTEVTGPVIHGQDLTGRLLLLGHEATRPLK